MSPANHSQACIANAPATAYPWLVYHAIDGLLLVRRTVRTGGVYLTAGASAARRGSVKVDARTARRVGEALIRMADGLDREGPQ